MKTTEKTIFKDNNEIFLNKCMQKLKKSDYNEKERRKII